MLPFPKLHLAESALNRIFNALEGDAASFAPPLPTPVVTDPIGEGAAIEQAAATPPTPAASPPQNQQASQDNLIASSATGGSPFDGALLGALQG